MDDPSGKIMNTATVTAYPKGYEGDEDRLVTDTSQDENGNPATVIEVLENPAALVLTKEGQPNLGEDGRADAGIDTITYTFTLKNQGNVTIEVTAIDDPKVGEIEGLPVTLAAGGENPAPITATYTLTEEDLLAGKVENTATASGTSTRGTAVSSNPASWTEVLDEVVDVDFEKREPDWKDVNNDDIQNTDDLLVYPLVVTNKGNTPITTLTIRDEKEGAEVKGERQDPLQPGDSDETSFQVEYTIKAEDVDNGTVENVATLTGKTARGGTIKETASHPPGGAPGEATTFAFTKAPRIRVEMSGTLDPNDANGIPEVGELIHYTITVFNQGNVTLENIRVEGVAPPQVVETAATGRAMTPDIDVEGGPLATLPAGKDDEGKTFSATHELTQDDLNEGAVLTQVKATGDPVPGDDGVQLASVEDLSDDPNDLTDNEYNDDPYSADDPVLVPLPEHRLLKVVDKQPIMPEGLARAGDVITYKVTLRNEGNTRALGARPVDAGPTFNGKPGTGSLSAFTPASVDLDSKAQQTFEAAYTLSAQDVANAAGIEGGVENTAGAAATSARDDEPIEEVEEATAKGDLPSFSATKEAQLAQVRRGERVPYTITLNPTELKSASEPITLIDTMPPGFTYIEGTATVHDEKREPKDEKMEPKVEGRRLVFENVPYTADTEEIVVQMQLGVSGAVQPGKFVNRAQVFLGDDMVSVASNVATAEVEVVTEPIFDCGDIVGKVFDDINRNGYQDEGEPGLAGARVATVGGLLITTDKHGRFHVACADLPDGRIGSTYLMKLDPRTLPTGYRIVSENPRSVRLTAGKASRINFAAAVGRVVRLDVNDAAFEPGQANLRPEWLMQMPGLISILEAEESVLRLAYIDAAVDRKLAAQRTRQLRRVIADLWKQKPGRYRLDVETRIETGK
ncbi:DUF7507 domain-containing protein [Chelativorans salis]|uniref:DUF7507 domain-containing protein n=1 Tax=Chelativorans salis TaxID=2978478 RepID=A0ABT2LNM9_9HYPH|nr:hypothetical protein [Chelativorans sp. EGI FJ00035]MCT7376014.1 hypothetical protein [Chelativorans sp. EGI FJ00035]